VEKENAAVRHGMVGRANESHVVISSRQPIDEPEHGRGSSPLAPPQHPVQRKQPTGRDDRRRSDPMRPFDGLKVRKGQTPRRLSNNPAAHRGIRFVVVTENTTTAS
jgi:hypothetical protein